MKKLDMAWMYILECKDGSYYVGSTTDIERRVRQHNQGDGADYTARRRPVKLVFATEFVKIEDAYTAEKQVQGWRRDKREALIRGDYDVLPALSRKIFLKKSTDDEIRSAPVE
ncbi:MAG: GIY-YIG nuclease family protein [Caldilineaceae bacterium]|nr:GIY-YIG nuclease family protein [Caldilineaceae bacterium]